MDVGNGISQMSLPRIRSSCGNVGSPLESIVVDLYMFMCYACGMKTARLIALIEPETMKALKAEGRKLKVSLAEVVRRAISVYLKK